MSYTPVELRHVKVGLRPLGYDRASIEQILSDVADSFEVVWRDRGELADRVEQLEEELQELKKREQLLTNTLVSAEHAAEDVRDRARREADLIVAEAHAEARSVLHSRQGEKERLLAEVHRIEALLRSALGVVEQASDPPQVRAEPAAAPPPPEQTPEERPEVRTIAVAPSPRAPSPPAQPAPEPSSPPAPESAAEQPAAEQPAVAAAEEPPGWPPLRRVAQGGAEFDWGD